MKRMVGRKERGEGRWIVADESVTVGGRLRKEVVSILMGSWVEGNAHRRTMGKGK